MQHASGIQKSAYVHWPARSEQQRRILDQTGSVDRHRPARSESHLELCVPRLAYRSIEIVDRAGLAPESCRRGDPARACNYVRRGVNAIARRGRRPRSLQQPKDL